MTDNLDTFLLELERDFAGAESAVLGGLDAAGFELVEFARSPTEQMRPPVRKGEGNRAATPGHWATDTGLLANSFGHEATMETDELAVLELSNTAEYAEALESLEDYWVLSGLEAGGHAQESIERNVNAALDAYKAGDL